MTHPLMTAAKGSLIVLVLTCSGLTVRSDQPAGQKLTVETLESTLQNMGYDPQTVKSTVGNPMYRLDLESSGWKFVIYVSISPNGENVWLSAPLATLAEGEAIPADVMRKLLEENSNIGPTHFKIAKENRRLYLTEPFANIDITPARMRTRIDGFMQTIKDTEPLWNQAKWPKTAAPAPAPPAIP